MHRSPSPVAGAVLAAAILLTTGCGYIAGPLVPLANVPQKISDLAAVQRGSNLIVHATLPTRTTENVIIKTPLKLDLRVGTAGDPFNMEAWANRARPISGAQVKDGIAAYKVPASDWIGKEVVLGIGSVGSNGKASGWSNFAIVSVVPPPEVPSTPDVKDTAAGERVTWTGRGNQFRVLRKSADDENFVTVATVTGHEWIDTTIEYGKTYTYMVQSLVDAGKDKVAESDLSDPTSRTPKDTFAPAVPTGLHAEATANSVALVWDGDTEPDLAGYRIYRSVGDGPWQKLADVNTVPSYSDTTVEHSKTYRYAVSAFDKIPNESDRSAPVEIVP